VQLSQHTPLPAASQLEPVPDTQIQSAEGIDAASVPPTNGRAADARFEADGLPGALFGYDRYSTEKRLADLAGRYEGLVKELAARDEQIRDLERELYRRQQDERLIGETLVAANRDAHVIRERARNEAHEALGTARKQATELLHSTKAEAESTAKELVESAERERKALLDEAARAKAFIEQTHEQLSEFLMAAVKWYEQAKLSTGIGTDAEGEGEAEADPGAEPDE
jgi:cell division septum initiation protein DivIVA